MTSLGRPEDHRSDRLFAGVSSAINRHGHAFVEALAVDVARNPGSWRVERAEVPVSVDGRETCVDLVLRHVKGHGDYRDRGAREHLAVVECKRTNPSFSTWAFMAAIPPGTNTRRRHFEPDIIFEHVRFPSQAIGVGAPVLGAAYRWAVPVVHYGYAIKDGDAKGDPSMAEDRGAIEAAAHQARLAQHGVTDLLLEALQHEAGTAIVVPMVVTTARLAVLVAGADSLSPTAGTLTVDASALTEQPWVFFQHPGSEGLRSCHTKHRGVEPCAEFDELLRRYYTRSVAIVTAANFRDFLEKLATELDDVRSPWKDTRPP